MTESAKAAVPPSHSAPENNEVSEVFERLRANHRSVGKATAATRVQKLLDLQRALLAHRPGLERAMHADFRKSPEEVNLTEVVPVVLEIQHAARHLERWMRPKKVRMPLPLLGTASEIHYEPKGVALIISPWNFPVNLTLGPLVSAVAAGNCALLKPSELTPHTSDFISDLIANTFDSDEVTVLTGDRHLASALLDLPFDHVFFTGSPAVGRHVMRAAAVHLSSVTLELGGKSPAIVTASADVDSCARAIAWGKFSNAGQACVAPDFVLVDERIASDLTQALTTALDDLNGAAETAKESPDFARIVDDRHFDRLQMLIAKAQEDGARIIVGGDLDRDTRYVEPTVLVDVPISSPIMSEEIFGPVLPVFTYRSIQDALNLIERFDPPLALYIFTADSETTDLVLSSTRSGGVVVNDVGIHFANPHLPFGGIKSSGIGRSHGHAGFMAFSNERSVMRQRLKRPPTRAFYPPYGETTRKLIEWFLRFVE